LGGGSRWIALTFAVFGTIVAALALVAAAEAWRTRPSTQRVHHRLAYQPMCCSAH
jgi:hypothetical protein